MYNITNPICYVLLLSTCILVRAGVQSNVSTQILAEGGALPQDTEDETHLSREHVAIAENNTATKVNGTVKSVKNFNVSQSINETSNKPNDSVNNNSNVKPVIEKPVAIDAGVSKKNDEKQSVGKKGVSFNATDSTEYVSLKETTPTIRATSAPAVTKPKPVTSAPIPKKPLITEHDNFVPNSEPKKTEPDPNFSYDHLEKKTKRANYVIPIVAVILSVPLVAIIISVLYKRGQDWWQHRNYRRMDFLIEGMYNN